jgi:hypothetical protein
MAALSSKQNGTQYTGVFKGSSGMDLTNLASNASPSYRGGEDTPIIRYTSPLG